MEYAPTCGSIVYFFNRIPAALSLIALFRRFFTVLQVGIPGTWYMFNTSKFYCLVFLYNNLLENVFTIQ